MLLPYPEIDYIFAYVPACVKSTEPQNVSESLILLFRGKGEGVGSDFFSFSSLKNKIELNFLYSVEFLYIQDR